MENQDPLVPLDKMDAPEPLALLDPEDSPELWDSPAPKESLVSLVSPAREVPVVLPALLALLAKTVMSVLPDLPVLLDPAERRESPDPPDLPDSRAFPDPKVLLVRLASLVIRALLVSLDLLAHLEQEETEVSPVSAVETELPAQLEAAGLPALLVTMEPRESLVLVVPPVVKDPPVCRECLVSVDLVVCPVSREREVMLEPREVRAASAKMAHVV